MADSHLYGALTAVAAGLALGLALFWGIIKIQSYTRGVTYAFSGRRLFLALLFLIFTFPLAWPVFPRSWNLSVPYPVNAVFLALNIVLILAAFRAPCLYCTECGAYIGTRPGSCPDCHCSTTTKIRPPK